MATPEARTEITSLELPPMPWAKLKARASRARSSRRSTTGARPRRERIGATRRRGRDGFEAKLMEDPSRLSSQEAASGLGTRGYRGHPSLGASRPRRGYEPRRALLAVAVERRPRHSSSQNGARGVDPTHDDGPGAYTVNRLLIPRNHPGEARFSKTA